MRNKYWVLRHGKSIPNEKGLIVSSLENGTREEYQLAPEGVLQAQSAAHLFLQQLTENCIPIDKVCICYSPFSRTTHTACLVASALGLPFQGPQCKMIEDLRERYFGPYFELMSHDRYAEIWAFDEKDPFWRPEGGESVSDVAFRLAKSLEAVDLEFQGWGILIVSHGDPLQILQTFLSATYQEAGSGCNDLVSRTLSSKLSPILSCHRRFALTTGELRRVV